MLIERIYKMEDQNDYMVLKLDALLKEAAFIVSKLNIYSYSNAKHNVAPAISRERQIKTTIAKC